MSVVLQQEARHGAGLQGAVEAAPRDHALRLARERLRVAREAADAPAVHRALATAQLARSAVVQVLAIAVVLTGALWWAREPLMQAWLRVVVLWSGVLGVPLAAGTEPGLALAWQAGHAQVLLPSTLACALAALGAGLLYGSTYRLRDAMTPVKYLVRTLCVVQFSAVAYFLALPGQFAYSVPRHVQSMLGAGFVLMLAIPALVGCGYALLRIPPWQRVVHPLLMLAYFAVMVPHLAVLHALLLTHLTVIVMPLLYLCFGVVFDVMLFVALYSWLASRVSPQAVAG